MSIGLQNPIGGSYSRTRIPLYFSPLGGGVPGFVPLTVNDTDDNDAFSQSRFTLRESWNTAYPAQLKKAGLKRVITPFRAVTNSGDVLARRYYSCGGACQTFQSRPGMFGLRGAFGAIQSQCDGTDVPPATCNVKYVYDSSDYITYKKLTAVNKTYNLLTNGGNNSSGSQSAYRAIRRY
jgi:hypothetical protein